MTELSPLDAAIERYLTFLQSDLNRAPLTVASYRQSLCVLSDLLGVSDPLEIDKAAVRRLKQRLYAYPYDARGTKCPWPRRICTSPFSGHSCGI